MFDWVLNMALRLLEIEISYHIGNKTWKSKLCVNVVLQLDAANYSVFDTAYIFQLSGFYIHCNWSVTFQFFTYFLWLCRLSNPLTKKEID